MKFLDDFYDYLDERPLIAMILYLMLLLFFVWHVNRHVSHIKDRESFDLYTILLLGLTLLGIRHIFRTSKDVVEYGKKASEKYRELVKRKRELNDKINKNIQSEQVNNIVLQEASLEIDKINAEIQYIQNNINVEQESIILSE